MWWPLHGLGWFLSRPRWWFLPLVLGMLSIGLVLTGGVLVVLREWPGSSVHSWHYLWQLLEALAWGISVMLALWVLVVPMVMGLAMEHLARTALHELGAAPAPAETLWEGMRANLGMLRGTWMLRVGWTIAALIGSWLGPLGLVVAVMGLSYLMSLDALLIALAARGIRGDDRLAVIRSHRGEHLGGSVVGAALVLLLGVSVLGWWLLMPGLVCGACEQVMAWTQLPSPRRGI